MSTPKAILSTITVIYFAPAIVMVLFSAFVIYQNLSGLSMATDEQTATFLRYALFALMPLGLIAAYFIYRQQLANIDKALPLKDKLTKIQTALLLRAACLEVPGLFGCIAAFLTGDNLPLIVPAIMLVIYILWRPIADRLSEDLELSQQDRVELE